MFKVTQHTVVRRGSPGHDVILAMFKGNYYVCLVFLILYTHMLISSEFWRFFKV